MRFLVISIESKMSDAVLLKKCNGVALKKNCWGVSGMNSRKVTNFTQNPVNGCVPEGSFCLFRERR